MGYRYQLSADLAESGAADCVVVAVDSSGGLSEAGRDIDRRCGGALSSFLEGGLIKGAQGSTVLVPLAADGPARGVLLTGTGDNKPLSDREFKDLVVAAHEAIKVTAARTVLLCLSDVEVVDRSEYWKIRQQVITLEERAYRFQSDADEGRPTQLESISIASQSADESPVVDGRAMAAAINIARMLGDTPPNVCTPAYIAEYAQDIAEQYDAVHAEVLNEEGMANLGMGALLSVGNGSERESRLVVLSYCGADKNKSPFVLIGKGITFDTGGTALKTRQGMKLMKYDMCGAAVTVAVLQAVAILGLPINVVAIAACAENMPGSKATRPSDVVTSMSGTSVEILNPDAEGRLVLCDALTYAKRFNPETVIDVATLTGASLAAVGRHYSAMFAYDDELAADLVAAGVETMDKVWRLPLSEEDLSQLDSDFADIANIGDGTAGCVVAALFLSRFAESFRWAHLDVSGTAKIHGDAVAATGRPAALLLQFLMNEAEKT